MGRIVQVGVLVVALVLYFYFFGDGFEPESIAGKRVLITGASSGIGEQLAYHYARLGAKLVITARREKLLDRVAAKCRELGAREATYVKADMAKVPERVLVVKAVEQRLGGLDHLVLNHATMPVGLWLSSANNMTALMTTMQVNFFSYVDMATKLMPMLERSKGSLGVLGSIAGRFAMPGVASYSTTKSSIIGFFSALRQELEFQDNGVSVTTCIMGPVATNIYRMTARQKKDEEELLFKVRATPEDASMAILRGIATRQSEIYFSWIASIIVKLHIAIPHTIENLFGKYTLEMATE